MDNMGESNYCGGSRMKPLMPLILHIQPCIIYYNRPALRSPRSGLWEAINVFRPRERRK